MNDKLKFYRNTLVQITKGLIGYTPMHKLAEDADKITKEIIGKVDEYEKSFNYQTQVNENPKINYSFGGDNCVAKDFTCTDPNFFKKGVNPDYLKTESMRTIVDNGPQYQVNQKPYGTLGEHWKELMMLFEIKDRFGIDVLKKIRDKGVLSVKADMETTHDLVRLIDTLGNEFIRDFIKTCEKCEE